MQRVRKQIEDVFGERLDGGTGVTIAVLDTGIGQHPDLSGRLLGFRDFVGQRQYAYDDNGHGTHICGILCGSGRLSHGKYRGIAPGARLVVGKVLDDSGEGGTGNMLQGLDWVLENRGRYGIRILNISVGIGDTGDEEKERLLREKLEVLWKSGIMVICAAGNKGPGSNTISSIGKDAGVMTVGCHDGSYQPHDPGRCALYSGRGPEGSLCRKPDLVAPGTNIVSCNSAYFLAYGRVKKAYIAKSGTSMATPIVAGAAALALQKYPSMSNADCRRKLQYTATDLGIPWNQQGWGMVNIRRLLE